MQTRHTPSPNPRASAPVRYRIEHETRYVYAAPVSQSWQLAHLTPRVLPWQKRLSCTLQIDPQPEERHEAPDCFDNTATHFGLHSAHQRLNVHMSALVEISARPAIAAPRPSTPWEAARDAARSCSGTRFDLEAALMREPSTLVPISPQAQAYAAPSFRPGRDWLDAVTDLMARIHHEFEFDPGATSVSTSVDEVLAHRRGVCQDFAHLMLACLRAMGLPARYMSGYLLTDPPPGQPRLMGADASHAWVAAYAPDLGWVEFDPTNEQRADQRYIVLAWGADFADVAPLRGVILGGAEQQLEVSVSVIPLD